MTDLQIRELNPTFFDKAEKVNDTIFTTDDVMFFEELGHKGLDVYEDDGNLHITEGEVRACFDIGQDTPRGQWIKEAKAILKGMNIDTKLLN